MKKPSKNDDDQVDWDLERDRIIGLGEQSLHKTYYPALLQNLSSLNNLLQAVEQTLSGILIGNHEGVVEFVNNAWCILTGFEREKLIGNALNTYWPDGSDPLQQILNNLKKGHSWHGDLSFNKAGNALWVQASMTPVFDNAGDYTHYIVVIDDITQRKLNENELEQQVEVRTNHLEQALDFNSTILLSSPLPMGIYSNTGACLLVNDAYARLLGQSRQQLQKQNLQDLTYWRKTKLVRAAFDTLNTMSPSRFEIELERTPQTTHWLDCWCYPTQVKGHPHVLLQLIDLTKRKKLENELRRSALYDDLTGLPNRRLLLDRLKQAIHKSERNKNHLAVIYLDLNHFKQLNDSYGHAVGDQMLKQVANRLQKVVRTGDTVARLGGDEFVVLMEMLDNNKEHALKDTKQMEKRLHKSLSRRYQFGQISYKASASIGSILSYGGQYSPGQLLKEADRIMYSAKRNISNKQLLQAFTGSDQHN